MRNVYSIQGTETALVSNAPRSYLSVHSTIGGSELPKAECLLRIDIISEGEVQLALRLSYLEMLPSAKVERFLEDQRKQRSDGSGWKVDRESEQVSSI